MRTAADRPLTVAGAKFHSRSYGCNTNRAQREREVLRMGSGMPNARPSIFDRHPFLGTLAIIVATAVGCFALFAGVMPR